ncbi:MAG: hypothetical protein LBS63_00985 [Prevotellaceae bacterium]|jgi:hypothetical protein|nr:hypothetical protein [Prevotellaceae bacterium]
MTNKLSAFCFTLLLCASAFAQKPSELGFREEVSLDSGGWVTAYSDVSTLHGGFELPTYVVTPDWVPVSIPHNWEDYQGYRRMKHGNLHGSAWYRRSFTVGAHEKNRRYFLYFEGVGSYATVWLNGKEVGQHAGGRTTFTIDVTDALTYGSIATNLLAVRADHPAEVSDLPWVCGGCSSEWGFSEGSQPLGIFRPVSLITTGDVRVEPFGVHVWNDEKITDNAVTLYVNTEVRNYSSKARKVTVTTRLLNADNMGVGRRESTVDIAGESSYIFQHVIMHSTSQPLNLWSPESPYLYKVATEIGDGKKIFDRTNGSFGIRKVSWPVGRNDGSGQLLINGKPFLLNGTCEYEHNMGNSHAFTQAQIDARVAQIRAAGFNAFRDAHQPHNLRYSQHWDRLGMPWWTQFSAHVWFDTPDFRQNFKTLLAEWVKERRNSPSLVMWGLQNESSLPEDFAKECVAIIRELDPTASKQRPVTTCNGGKGADWNVVQNWSGTYGGDPATYADDLAQQHLNGEYGAWRSIDLHTEGGYTPEASLSEDRMTALLEMKMRLAEQAKGKTAGHFHWLFNSHENPGRTQNGEGLREIDRLGPVNYKGLITAWGEPVDAFYMYRAYNIPKAQEPMVYIPMHTWPDRWITTGVKNNVVIYSNCDKVQLWCDTVMLGEQQRRGSAHFTFNNVKVTSNLLHAYGWIDGSRDVAASDFVQLHHLPKSKYAAKIVEATEPQNLTEPREGYSYLYRVNCGGPDYTDINGNLWQADAACKVDTDAWGFGSTWGSRSWTNGYAGLPPFYGSQRRTNDLIGGTLDGTLFQTFRYGRHKLAYEFPLPNGSYTVELLFVEPWFGRGNLNAAGWRVFDVAVNGATAIKDLDIWREAGGSFAYKREVPATVTNGTLTLSFPKVTAGQAVIAGIAVGTQSGQRSISSVEPSPAAPPLITNLVVEYYPKSHLWAIAPWMDTGDKQYADDRQEAAFSTLPPALYGATWLCVPKTTGEARLSATFSLSADANVYIGIAERYGEKPAWMKEYLPTQTYAANAARDTFTVYSRHFTKGEMAMLGPNVSGQAPMYIVAAAYGGSLEPAADLRPATRVEIAYTRYYGEGIQYLQEGERTFVHFANPTEEFVEFPFAVGVADTYAVHIRYRNQTGSAIPMLVQVEDAAGAQLHTATLKFEPTTDGKFKTLSTTTGTQINAGSYTLRLSAAGVQGLEVHYVELQ